MIIKNLDQRSQEWLSWRADKITASMSAAIFGKSKFITRYELYNSIKGIYNKPTENNFTKSGINAEESARSTFEILYGEFENYEPICVESDRYNFIAASLDGYNFNKNIILEIKYPSQKTHEEIKTGKIPDHYWIQMQHQFLCCEKSTTGYFFSYRERDSALITVNRDNIFIDNELLPKILEFKSLLDSNTPPEKTEDDFLFINNKTIDDLILLFENSENKEERLEIGKSIINSCGWKKIRTNIGSFTSVYRNNSLSHFMFRRSR